jgi:hypothetical protein
MAGWSSEFEPSNVELSAQRRRSANAGFHRVELGLCGSIEQAANTPDFPPVWKT